MSLFTKDFLTEYTDDALVEELQRVSSLVPDGPLTAKKFDASEGRVSASTVRVRFGGWKAALDKAGIGERYSGTAVSDKHRKQHGKSMSAEAVIAELRRVHSAIGTRSLSAKVFNRMSEASESTVYARFGTWPKALAAAGIPQYSKARKHTDQELFENLANTWTHFARRPSYDEMKHAPSTISPKSYVRRWRTWRGTLNAFLEWAEEKALIGPVPVASGQAPQLSESAVTLASEHNKGQDCRDVRPALRFKVFQRDSFRCVLCGRSPATEIGVTLHTDHILAVARGGKTIIHNLQTLCSTCNLGKGTSRILIF